MINHLIQWIYAHPNWGGLIALIIAAMESMAIIGTIVPGSVMLIAVGTLIGTGVLPLWSTLIWAICGAILGDGLSYWLGYALQDKIRKIWPFSRYPKILETGENYFKVHGGKSIFLGRFVGPVRALVPMISGMIGLKPLKFFSIDIISGILWAPLYMAPGYILGSLSLNLPPNIAINLIIDLLILLACVIFFTWLFHLLITRVSHRLHLYLDKFWLHLQQHRREHFLTIWFKSSDKRHVHGQIGSALAILILGFLFILLFINVMIRHGGLIVLNEPLHYFFRGLRVYGIEQIFVCITFFGQVNILLPAMILFAIVLYIAKYKRPALHCLGLTFLATFAAYFIKEIAHYPRPDQILGLPITYSFPSGHTTLSVAFYGFIAMLLLKTIRNSTYRKIIYYGYVTILVLICFSRLYLGAHWFTDIIGGLLLGGLCFFIMKVLYYREPVPAIKPSLIIITCLLSIAISWTTYFMRHFHDQVLEYERTWPETTLAQTSWWQGNGKHPLLYREDRFGKPKEALNLQWAAQLNTIQQTLTEQNWKSIPDFYWSDLLHPAQFAERVSVVKILPQLFRNSAPQAVFIKRLADKQVIALMLWNTHITLLPDHTPLWVGLVRYQQIYENEKPLPMPTESPLDSFTTQSNNMSWKIVDYPVKSVNGHRLELADKLLLINKPQ